MILENKKRKKKPRLYSIKVKALPLFTETSLYLNLGYAIP